MDMIERLFVPMQNDTIEQLRRIITLSDLPDAHLQWLAERMEYAEYEDGVLIVNKGEPADWMWFVLEGKVDFYMDVHGQQVYYYNFQNDHVTGGAGGLLPYSRMKSSPGYAYAVGLVKRFALHKKYFQELEQLNPALVQRLIGYMTERARSFATTQMQLEKVSALGRLSAGIAHELNNPASAINRISSELTTRLNLNYELTEKLLHHKIGAERIQSLRRKAATLHQNAEKRLSALQRMEREDEITAWLSEHGLPGKLGVAEPFADAGFTGGDLDAIAGDESTEALADIIRWFENLLSSQRILRDLGEASSRISNLVGAIKSHVQMDRTNELQPTDIHKDIENTLTLLGYKLRDKHVAVKKNFCDNLPPVPAYIGELNQVWTNIIDNAIYALGKDGELTIETICDPRNVTVKVIDNGPGIPPEIISRIFDPFFTTKKVGEGTGIGLDLVNRIIKRHSGTITVNSKPGRTEFLISLPLTEQRTDR